MSNGLRKIKRRCVHPRNTVAAVKPSTLFYTWAERCLQCGATRYQREDRSWWPWSKR